MLDRTATAVLAVLVLTWAALCLIMAMPARAQEQGCASRDAMVAGLAARYGEVRQSIGLAGTGQLVEVFASPETGSWTITVTTADGLSCMVAVGAAFERFDLPAEGDPA